MKKIVLTLLCLLITSMALAIEKPCKKPCDIENADSLTVEGTATITSKTPTLVCSATIQQGQDFEVIGNVAYVLEGDATNNHQSGAIKVISTTDCSLIGMISNEALQFPHTIKNHKGFLYISQVGDSHSIAIFSIEQSVLPSYVGSIAMNGFTVGKPIQFLDGDILVATGASTDTYALWFFDVSNPYSWKFLTGVKDSGTGCTGPETCLDAVQTMYCDEASNWCIVGDDSEDHMVSVYFQRASDGTASAHIVDVLEDTNFANFSSDYATCTNNRCYFPLCTGTLADKDLAIINITNKWGMSKVSATAITGATCLNGIWKSGNTIYGAAEVTPGTLFAIDISNESSPTLLWSKVVSDANHGLHTVKGRGDKIFTIDQYAAGETGHFYVYQTNSLDVDNLTASDAQTGNLVVTGRTQLEGPVNVMGSTNIGGGLAVNKSLTAGNGFQVSTSNLFSGTPSLSYNEGVSIGLNGFQDYENILYSFQSSVAEIGLCCGLAQAGAGNVWQTVTFGAPYDAVYPGCKFDGEMLIGTGYDAGDANLLRCSAKNGGGDNDKCDNAGDFTSSGLIGVATTQKYTKACIGWQGYVYAGTGGDAGHGDIFIGDPGAGVLDNAADWTVQVNSTSAFVVTDFEPLGSYLYSSFSGDATDLIKVCNNTSTGKCVWTSSLAVSGSGHTSVEDLLAADGALWALMDSGDLWVCRTTDGLCDTEWVEILATTEAFTKLAWLEGKLILTGSVLAGADVYQLDKNADTGTTQITKIWNPAGRGMMSVYPWHGALWFGEDDALSAGTFGDIYTWPIQSGKISMNNGDRLEGNGVSSIVDSVSVTGQTADIAETNLFIPPSDGVYRIITYAVATTPDAGATLQVNFMYTDNEQAQTINAVNTLDMSASTPATATTVVYAKAHDPITYSTDHVDAGGLVAVYELYITVERLK